MESIKIILAAAVLILASNVLTGCSPKNAPSDVAVQRIEAAQEVKKVVELKLERVESEGDVRMKIVLENPEKKPISSAQVWLTYNPDHLEGLSIDTSDSPFELMAPYTNDFDSAIGLVMLGRSSETAVNDKEIVMAEVSFKKLTEGSAMIQAYDYTQDLQGHSSVNMMADGNPVNVLIKPATPLLVIEN